MRARQPRRVAARRRPRPDAPGSGRSERARAGSARARLGAGAASVAGQPPQLLGDRGLRALLIPLLPAARPAPPGWQRAGARPRGGPAVGPRAAGGPRARAERRPRARHRAACGRRARPALAGLAGAPAARGLDFRRPRAPREEDVAALIERNGAEVRAEEIADLIDMVERFARSELCGRLGAA